MARSERRFIASADVVYSIVVDAARYPRWLVGARRVRVRDPSWPRAGSSFDHRVGAGPVEVHDATTVTKNVPGRILELNVRARPFLEAIVRFEVRPDGEGCRLTMDEVPSASIARWPRSSRP